MAPAALPGSDLTIDRLGVAMDARGRLLVAGEALDEAAASAWWAAQAKARRAGLETLGEPAAGDDLLPTVVILRADRSASYGAVRRTLAEAQDRASPILAWSSCGEARHEHGDGAELVRSGVDTVERGGRTWPRLGHGTTGPVHPMM